MSALNLRRTVRVPFAVALALLLVFAGSAEPAFAKKAKKKKSNTPTVTAVTPAKASIGDTLIITGKNFTAGVAKNTVIFRPSAGGKNVFAPTVSATSKRLVLKVPTRIADQFEKQNGVAVATRFQLRVVSTRASTGFTAVGKSPLILPGVGGSAIDDCDKDGIVDVNDADDDNDGLSDAIETQYKLGTCSADTDGDGVWDSFEFESALDLNGRAVPYPGKKPWPNPLDGSDAGYDFDGDGLLQSQEHQMWQAAGRPFPMNYSDGTQYTGGPVAAPNPDIYSLDADAIGETVTSDSPETINRPISLRTGIGYLSDDEKDFDGDGLANLPEFRGNMTQGYWRNFNANFNEGDYTYRVFADLDGTDPDSDGDGVLDGFDDQDADGWNNISEQYRTQVYSTGFNSFMVNPYNPCLPDYHSASCTRYLFGKDVPSPFHLALPEAPIGWASGLPTANSPAPGYVP